MNRTAGTGNNTAGHTAAGHRSISLTNNIGAKRISVVKWAPDDGLAMYFGGEFARQNLDVQFFLYDQLIPLGSDVVFSFGPYGRIAQIAHRLSMMPYPRPCFIHWHTESLPSPRIPRFVVRPLGRMRSQVDRLCDADGRWGASLAGSSLFGIANRRLTKFRYVGDYDYAHRLGVLDCLVDTSVIYRRLHLQAGYRGARIPWGTFPETYAALNLKRDIDVLWMGKRRTRRRSRLLDHLKAEFARLGITMYVADNEENPFLFGEERTQFLNRAKIVLNLMPTWYDPNFPYRFHLAAANSALVISEPFAPHYPEYIVGEHYVEASDRKLVSAIERYLSDDQQRERIVENAHELTTKRLTMANSVRQLLNVVPQNKMSNRT